MFLGVLRFLSCIELQTVVLHNSESCAFHLLDLLPRSTEEWKRAQSQTGPTQLADEYMDHRATHILRLVQSLNRSQKYSHSRKVLRLDKHPGLPAATQLTSLRGELSTAPQPHVTHRGTPPIRRASFMRKEVSAGPMSFCPRPNCARKN